MPLASDRDEEINMLARLWNAPRQQTDATELSYFAANWERVLQALAMQPPVQTFSERTEANMQPVQTFSERISGEWREREISELMAMTQNLEKEIKKQAEKPEIKRKNRYQILKENSADEHKSPI
jgi:hypothetical protein